MTGPHPHKEGRYAGHRIITAHTLCRPHRQRRVVIPLLLAGWASNGYGYQSCLWPAGQGKCNIPCSRSRLRIWSRGTGSTVPSWVSPLILHTQAESDWLMVLTPGSFPFSRFPRWRPSIPSTAIGSVPMI